MMRTDTTSRIDRPAPDGMPSEAVAWIRRHAPLTELCQFGGWPDDAGLTVELCSRSPHKWIVNIRFDETIMEISECDVTRRPRCGQYAVDVDDAGHPAGIRLLQAL